uniref:Uncharacterized protein n=1 Tax=Phytophthora fragariae TaxID=53985 RepID=A0A6A3EMP0_9STRA|nr:hypothetical protein PF009_g16219 [Phytophthora fragariae]
MEKNGDPLQPLRQERPKLTKQDDGTPEPTVISRRQAELEAANDRLQRTAQNFSIEWKSFLGYAMKIKQQRANGATTSPPTGERDLEDLLLKTQGGLVLLRELHNRRDEQWKAVREHFGYEHSSPNAATDEDKSDPPPPQQVARQPQWLHTLTSKLLELNQQVAVACHCALKRSQLTVDQHQTPTTRKLPMQSPVLVKQRSHALETHHRLLHALHPESSPLHDFVTVDDVNKLLQFNYMKHQQAVVLERFCTRLKWLPVSHRFHLRQRMLALIHQQKVKNTPRPTAYHDSKVHIHCPLFMMSTSHFITELKHLAQKCSLTISSDSKASAEEYEDLRRGADAYLASAVSTFPPDNVINSDASLEVNLESLVHAYTQNSRWELIQRGYLRNCEPRHGSIEETLIALRNDHKIDSLLANEWELLSLDDVEYLRVRLEALSRAHMNRAKVDVTNSEPAAVANVITEEATVDDEADEGEGSKPKTGLPHAWNPDALYSLYVLRVSSCRTRRLSLLRLLNYLHFVQLCQTSSLPIDGAFKVTPDSKHPIHAASMPSTFAAGSADGAMISPWMVTKCEKTGDYVVTRVPGRRQEDINDEDNDSNSSQPQEFIFAAARRDLEVLELQMLRIASIFIFKQEYDSLPTSPRKRNSDKYGNDQESDSIVTTIDRLQVLRDIYDCELAFQQAKAQLVERLLECGLEFSPRPQDISELGLASPEDHTEPFAAILFPLLQRRPLIDFSHAYFFESYAAETLLLELQTSLVQQMAQHFQRLEWSALREFAFSEESNEEDEKHQWILADVYRNLHEQPSAPPTLVECLAQAIELDIWRQKLTKSVYEAHLLERIHNFQFGFVKQVAAFDTVVGGEQARHLPFFFDFGDCDRTKSLQPIAFELETPMFHASASKFAALCSGDGKSISEWLQTQLSALHTRTGDSGDNDDITTQAKHSETWRSSLLELQEQYVSYMTVIVGYQDAVGADVYEFAASYPYVCLANSLAPESSSSSDENSTLAMDINTVRTKYAKEISDKMTEEMRTSCFPYWKRLENLKQQLQERFTTAPSQTSDGLKAAFASLQPRCHLEVDMAACGQLLGDEMHHPKLLIALNDHLQRLRNEKRLMQQLSPAARARCAFTTRSATTDRFTNEALNDEDQPSGLTKWLLVKLHQLKEDLQIHERPKVEQLLLTPPAARVSPSAAAQRAKRTFGTTRSTEESSVDVQTLLQTIPTFRCLLQTFAVSYEKPRRDSTGGAASAHAARLHEHREETLRVLLSIFNQLSCTLDLLWIRCGSRFATTRYTSSGSGLRYVPIETSSESPAGGVHSGLGRLERWQTQFHYEVRHLLDDITCRLSPEAAITTGDLFDTHPEHLKSQYYASLMRQEVHAALQEASAHSMHMLRCTTNYALLQTYQKNAGIRVRKRRQHLVVFLSSLENIATTAMDAPQARMRRLVRAGETAFFAEARPREREREWQSFKDAIGKYEPRDRAYIAAITRLLELHRVFIDENCQALLRLEEEAASASLIAQCAAENQALIALDELWDRFQLPAWDSLLGDEGFLSRGRSTAPVVGGKNLHMKKRLLGNADGAASPSSEFSSPNDPSFALRSLHMSSATALVQFCNTGVLVLPPPSIIEDQLSYLEISVELTWVNADMKELEEQYKKLMLHRKTHREHQRLSSATPRKPPKYPQAVSGPTCSTAASSLLALNKYFHQEGVPDDKAQQPESSSGVSPERKPKKREPAPVFVVPASEVAQFLHDITSKCVEHSQQLLDLQNTAMQQLRDQSQAVTIECQQIEKQWAKAKAEERIRREAFAVDHAFHLYFEVEALRKQLGVVEARRELEQQILRCDLNAEYDEKLRVMHAELLNKQQKFAEYRTTMQRELQTVIQGAHSQFVDQLLDYSGAIPSATKTSVATLLRGQQDVVRIKSENAAMKQALLRVQALGDMQQQTQNAARERELLLTQRFATAEALQRNEVEKLQAYVKQLEGNMSKLSQEKTYFQVKWTTAQKQMEATAQRRREAKIRALSATYTRTMPTTGATGSDDDTPPAIVINTRVKIDAQSDTESVTEPGTARPPTATSTVDAAQKQERQRLEAQYLNTTRHYQNEIRRLQQQVTREIREKAAIAEQLTQLRQYESSASIQPRDGLPLIDDPQTPRTPRGEDTFSRRDHLLPSTPRRSQSASPRTPTRAAPPDRSSTPRRPKSSFSPRTSLLRAHVAGSQPPVLEPCSIAPGSAASSRPNSSAGTPVRKFQVVKRETHVVGGVAGVSNTLSIREPLPYR